MRTSTVSALFGFGVVPLFALGMAGCPSSFSVPCRGFECEELPEDSGVEGQAKHRTKLSIASVSVDGNPSRVLRQGFGGAPSNGTTTVRLTGEHLDTVSDVTIGDGPDALAGTVTSKTSTELSFTVAIRHGAPIGAQPIIATATDGSATFATALVITAITAAPTGSDELDFGLDSTGTDERPMRSMSQAFTLAAAGDTVVLKNGTYDMDHGETFAETTKHGVIPNVPPDITIIGESSAGTLLQGPGLTNCGHVENRFVALAAKARARIETLRIAGFCASGISSEGGLTVKAVAIRDSGSGVNAGGPDTTIDSVDISGTDEAIVVRNLVGTVTISNSRIHDNVTGISGSEKSILVLTASEIDHNGVGGQGIPEGGVVVSGTTVLTDASIHDNAPFGVSVAEFSSNGALDIAKSRFLNNRSAAIFVGGPAKVRIRDSAFGQDSKEIHINSEAATIDLGTSESPGENSFSICATCDAVFDARPAPVDGLKPITLTGNSWSTGDPPKGCSDVDHPKAMLPPRFWHIEHPGSCKSKGNVIMN